MTDEGAVPQDPGAGDGSAPQRVVRRVQSFGGVLDIPSAEPRPHLGLSRTKSLGVRVVWRTPQSADLDNLNRVLRIPLRHRSPSPSPVLITSRVTDHIFSEHFNPLAVQGRPVTTPKEANSTQKIEENLNQSSSPSERRSRSRKKKSLDEMKMPSVKSLKSLFEREGKEDLTPPRPKVPRRSRTLAGGDFIIAKEELVSPSNGLRTSSSSGNVCKELKVPEVFPEKQVTIVSLRNEENETQKNSNDKKYLSKLSFNNESKVPEEITSPVKNLKAVFERGLSSSSSIDHQVMKSKDDKLEVKEEETDVKLPKQEILKKESVEIKKNTDRSNNFSHLKKQWEELAKTSAVVSKFKTKPDEGLERKRFQTSAPHISIEDVEQKEEKNIEDEPKSPEPAGHLEPASNLEPASHLEPTGHLELSNYKISEYFVRQPSTRGSVRNLKQMYENKRIESTMRDSKKFSNNPTITTPKDHFISFNKSESIESDVSVIKSAQINPHLNAVEALNSVEQKEEEEKNIQVEEPELIDDKSDKTEEESNKNEKKEIIPDDKIALDKEEVIEDLFKQEKIKEKEESEIVNKEKSIIDKKEASDNPDSEKQIDDIVEEKSSEAATDFITVSDDEPDDIAKMERRPSVRDLLKQYESNNKSQKNFTSTRSSWRKVKQSVENREENTTEIGVTNIETKEVVESHKETVTEVVVSKKTIKVIKNAEIISNKSIEKEKNENKSKDSESFFEQTKEQVEDKEEMKNDIKPLDDKILEPKAEDIKPSKRKLTNKKIEQNSKTIKKDETEINERLKRKSVNEETEIENNDDAKLGASSITIQLNDTSGTRKNSSSNKISKLMKERSQSEGFLEVPPEEIISPPVNISMPKLQNATENKTSKENKTSTFVRKSRSQSTSNVPASVGKIRDLKPDEMAFFQNIQTTNLYSNTGRDRSSSSPSVNGLDSSNGTKSKKYRDLHSDELKFFDSHNYTKSRSSSDVSLRQLTLSRSYDMKINEEDVLAVGPLFVYARVLDFLSKDLSLLCLALISLFLFYKDVAL